MNYIIMRQDGAFVTPSGSASSYTRDILKARKFATREAAERERCPENESVVSLYAILERGR